MVPDRWEHGSDFPWPSFAPRPAAAPLPGAARRYASGRDALVAVYRHGRDRRGWQRLLLPTYFCQEVAASLRAAGVPLATYADRPTLTAAEFAATARPGDAVLVVNYFGLRTRPVRYDVAGVDVIEDHTHDPWSAWAQDSSATYCIASLRKTLPIPDGGAAWSPRGAPLPAPLGLTDGRASASALRLAAMLLKDLYLRGHDVAKEQYRRLAAAGEAAFGSGPPAGMSPLAAGLLDVFPVDAWRQARRAGFDHLAAAIGEMGWGEVMEPHGRGTVPFGVTLVFPNAADRERARSHLIAQRIYPPVLWSLASPAVDGVGAEDVDLSERVLLLHCDMRYAPTDLARVAAELAAARTSAPPAGATTG